MIPMIRILGELTLLRFWVRIFWVVMFWLAMDKTRWLMCRIIVRLVKRENERGCYVKHRNLEIPNIIELKGK